MPRDIRDLHEMSKEILCELQILFGTAQALREDIQGPAQGLLPWPQRIACIEAFALHARSIEAFLWGSPNKHHPDDAFATDYFEAGLWEEIREHVQRSALDQVRDRAGHEIAHLSYKRLGKPEDAREWKFDVIAGVIGNAFRLFLKHVTPALVCDNFESRLRSIWPMYLNAPIAMSFPPDCETLPAITVSSRRPYDARDIHQATFEEMLPRNRP